MKTSIKRNIRIAILQRVCPNYRVSLFKQLSATRGIEVFLFIGDDIPNSKVRSSKDLSSINYKKLKTRFINFGSRTFAWHAGLFNELKKFNPDVILCEGESHFIGYLQAICYRILFNRRAALIHWCFIALPGEENKGVWIRALVKRLFRKFFDAFLVYSTYSKRRLAALGIPTDKIFVATNVGDTGKFLALSDNMAESPSEARKKLGLPERFTVLYSGALDRAKRPEMLLDLAHELDTNRYNFVLIGSGPLLNKLRSRKSREKLFNVFLPGRVVDDLPLYYRAADVLLVPGRGGIVISEAMAFGLTVIVHQADGTEYDLIKNGENGLLLAEGSLSEFRRAIKYLFGNRKRCRQMGSYGKELIRTQFSTGNMTSNIICAAKYARHHRNGRTRRV